MFFLAAVLPYFCNFTSSFHLSKHQRIVFTNCCILFDFSFFSVLCLFLFLTFSHHRQTCFLHVEFSSCGNILLDFSSLCFPSSLPPSLFHIFIVWEHESPWLLKSLGFYPEDPSRNLPCTWGLTWRCGKTLFFSSLPLLFDSKVRNLTDLQGRLMSDRALVND